MTMLAEVVDAVVGGDTHRDTHALEMVAPNGRRSPRWRSETTMTGSPRRSRGSPGTCPARG